MSKLVRRISSAIVILLFLFLVTPISSSGITCINLQGIFTLDALTWEAQMFHCTEGVVLSGSFEVSCDGALYIGDEQKYDDWAPESIHFYILNETEYTKFSSRIEFSPSYSRNTVTQLDWEYDVIKPGKWYVVYYNPTIYMMTVDNQIQRSGEIDLLILFGIVTGCFVVVLGFILAVKKKGGES